MFIILPYPGGMEESLAFLQKAIDEKNPQPKLRVLSA